MKNRTLLIVMASAFLLIPAGGQAFGAGTVNLTWNTFLGGLSGDNGYAIAVDAGGNIFVAGKSDQTWGSPVRAFTGGKDAFVAKLNGSGVLQWNTFVGESNTSSVIAGIALGPSGDIYVAYDSKLVKVTGSGLVTWELEPVSGLSDHIDALAADASGNVYMAGFSLDAWGGTNTVRAFSGGDDSFAAKFNSDGILQWNTFLGPTMTGYSHGIAVDAGGNAYVTGTSSATWGTPVRAFGGAYDAFAAKLNGSGALQWNTFLGAVGNTDVGSGIAVDPSGNVYITGRSDSIWGTPVRLYSGSGDAFAAKLNASGALQWNGFLGGSSYDTGNGITLDPSGNVYVVGSTGSNWGSPDLPYTGNSDAFVAKLNNNGAPMLWNVFLGATNNHDYGSGIAVDASGTAYVVGYGALSWGSPIRPINASAAQDAFVAKLSSVATQATLTLTSPNGAEAWIVGSAHNITWTSTGAIANVKIELSQDNGSNWTTIIASTPNDGTHPWTLPYAASNQCLIRVSDASNAALFDVSNNLFRIYSDITEPNNDAASASILPLGTTPNLVYDGINGTDIDWYKFFVPPSEAGKDLKVNVRVTSPYPVPPPTDWRSDVDFELLDGGLKVRGVVISGSDNETLYIANAPSGWYYIYIGYITTDYADATDHADYSITLETGTAFGLGYLSGRVVNGAGQGIEQVFLTLTHAPDDWNVSFPCMTTGPGGYYTIAYVPGAYDLQTAGKANGRTDGCVNQAPINVVAEYYNDKKSIGQSNHLTLAAGATQNLVNVVLETGAIVEGRVTDPSANPLAGAWVGSYDSEGNTGGNLARTNANGEYSLNGVPVGGAKMRFWITPAIFATEYYDNKPTFGSGTLLATVAGGKITGINAQMGSGGTVSGTVTNTLANPVSVNVRLFSVLDETWSRAGLMSDAGTGGFSFAHVPPGDYKIFFNAAAEGYAPEWYADAATFAAATVVTVTEGGTASGKNGVLAALNPEINLKQAAVSIATGGTYAFGSKALNTDTDTVFTIESLGTDALTLTGLPLTITGADANQFSIIAQPATPVAPAGTTTFTVRFRPTAAGAKTAQVSIACNDASENPYVLNLTGTGSVPASMIILTSPNGGENWMLGSGHSITWTSTGAGANVKIEYSTNGGTDWMTIIASKANNGTYYWVPGSWTDPALNTTSATCLVRVSDAAAPTIVDVSDAFFTISNSGMISGTVTDLSGNPIPDITVRAYTLDNVLVQAATDKAVTDAAGQYRIPGLGTGHYKVLFLAAYQSQNYLSEWYNDKPDFNTSDPVAVTVNVTTPNINAQLGPGGIISGRVTDEGGAGLAGVTVTAWPEAALLGYWSATTDGSGNYRITGLPAGNCRLMFQLTGYPLKFYSDSYSFGQAANVPVTNGVETPNINMTLVPGGTISGRVTDGGGNPVSGIQIIAYDATSNMYLRTSGGLTAADGTYSINVRAGQTKILFDASTKAGSGLRSQFYSGQTSLATAGAVAVAKNGTTPNIDGVLAAGGGTLTINVRNGLGQGVPATVYLQDALHETRLKLGAGTNASGYLQIMGLLPGNYKLQIYDSLSPFGRYDMQWYDNALTFGNAAAVNVTEGGNTPVTVVLGATAPQAGTLTVVSPNGGESWIVGSAHDITWTSTGIISDVKIEYSTNNGSIWTTIKASTPNDGSYAWTIPNTPSIQCLVRISDASTASISDISQAVFTISAIVTHTISGTITVGGLPLANVALNGLPGNPATNALGVYQATVNTGWSGTATPTLAGYGFTPASRSYTAVAASQTAQDYAANSTGGTMILGHVPASATSGILVDASAGISGNQASISTFGLEFVYDATMFDYVGVSKGTLTGNWATIAGNNLGNGRIRIGGFAGGGTTVPALSTGSLVKVNLRVKSTSYGNGTTATSRIEEYADGIAVFTPMPKTAVFTYQACPGLGDVNGDGSKTPGDAQNAFEIYLGLLVATDCQKATSDPSCSGTTTPGDAQMIFDDYLGRIILPGSCTGTAPQASGLAASRPSDGRRVLSLIDTISRENGTVVVPVVLTNLGGIREFGFTVGYRSDVLEFAGVLPTPLTKDFEIKGLVTSPGMVRIEGVAERPAASAEELGALARLVFRLREGAAGSTELVLIEPAGDLARAETRAGRAAVAENRRAENETIEIGKPLPQPDGTLTVPVAVSEAFGIGAFGIELSYEPSELQFLGVRRTDRTRSFAAVDAQEDGTGRLRVGGYRASGILERGRADLVELVFLPLTAGAPKIEIRGLVDDLIRFTIKK